MTWLHKASAYLLILAVAFLVVVGAVTLYSTSYFANERVKKKKKKPVAVEVAAPAEGTAAASAGEAQPEASATTTTAIAITATPEPAAPVEDANASALAEATRITDGSAPRPRDQEASSYLRKQLIAIGIGIVICAAAAASNYHWWSTLRIWVYGLALLLLSLCFVPGVGKKINDARRWVGSGSTVVQPSELGKLALVVVLAWWFSREKTQIRSFRDGIVIPLLLAAPIIGLTAPEPDLGTAALLIVTTGALMFIAGVRLIYVILPVLIAGGGFIVAIKHMPERQGRIFAFMDPEKYPDDAYHQKQGLIAFGAGGISGVGLGEGRQKMAYLPYAHTDFIFPMVGEEMGLRVTLPVVTCFVIILTCGTLISLYARDRFGMLLGMGSVVLICTQAVVNIGVTTSLLPNKGMPLPFISYGGSNITFCFLIIGILLSIFRLGENDHERKRSLARVNATLKRQQFGNTNKRGRKKARS